MGSSAGVVDRMAGSSRYRGTSLIRNTPLLGPNSRNIKGPVVVLEGGAGSYERGAPVCSASRPLFPSGSPSCGEATIVQPPDGLYLQSPNEAVPKGWPFIWCLISTLSPRTRGPKKRSRSNMMCACLHCTLSCAFVRCYWSFNEHSTSSTDGAS